MRLFSDEELQSILDRDCIGLEVSSGLGFSALDIIDDLVREILELRKVLNNIP